MTADKKGRSAPAMSPRVLAACAERPELWSGLARSDPSKDADFCRATDELHM